MLPIYKLSQMFWKVLTSTSVISFYVFIKKTQLQCNGETEIYTSEGQTI